MTTTTTTNVDEVDWSFIVDRSPAVFNNFPLSLELEENSGHQSGGNVSSSYLDHISDVLDRSRKLAGGVEPQANGGESMQINQYTGSGTVGGQIKETDDVGTERTTFEVVRAETGEVVVPRHAKENQDAEKANMVGAPADLSLSPSPSVPTDETGVQHTMMGNDDLDSANAKTIPVTHPKLPEMACAPGFSTNADSLSKTEAGANPVPQTEDASEDASSPKPKCLHGKRKDVCFTCSPSKFCTLPEHSPKSAMTPRRRTTCAGCQGSYFCFNKKHPKKRKSNGEPAKVYKRDCMPCIEENLARQGKRVHCELEAHKKFRFGEGLGACLNKDTCPGCRLQVQN